MRIRVGALAFLLFGAAANSAGATDRDVGSSSTTPSVDWSGFYLGVNAGRAWSNADFSITQTGSWVGNPADLAAATDGSFDLNGGSFGGLLGYNVQYGRWLLGIEADLGSLSAESRRAGGAIPSTSINSFSQRAEVSWMASIRGRLGVTFDRALLYTTAGVAFADWDVGMLMDAGGLAIFDKSVVQSGWIAGGGVEFALNRNWSLKGEYLYADFGVKGSSAFQPPSFPSYTHDHKVKLETQILRAGLNYTF